MGFLQGKLMKIRKSSLFIINALFNSSCRHVKRQKPNLEALSRELNEIFQSNRISVNTDIPSSISRVLEFTVRRVYKSFMSHMREQWRNQRIRFSVNLSNSMKRPEELPVVGLNPELINKRELLLSFRMWMDYLYVPVCAVGLVVSFTNLQDIRNLLKFSMRLENTLRKGNNLIILESKHKDDRQ